MTRKTLRSLALGLLMLPALSTLCHAQSYIFAVPGATVVGKDTQYIEGGFLATPRAYDDGGARTGVLRGIWGLSDNLEVGLNFTHTWSQAPASAELQPNLKFRWFDDKDVGLQISSGLVGYIPLTYTDSERAFGMGYTVARLQTNFAGAYSPAFSAGGWGLVNNNTPGSKAGVILGLEQPLILEGGKPKLSLVADWMSGDQTHAGFSSLNAGLIYQVNERSVLGLGYSLSNVDRRYDAAMVWFGMSF